MVDEKGAWTSLGVANVFHIVECDKSIYEITLHVDLNSVGWEKVHGQISLMIWRGELLNKSRIRAPKCTYKMISDEMYAYTWECWSKNLEHDIVNVWTN